MRAGRRLRLRATEAPGREAAGCAGKLAVFAVRLDTFEAEKETAVFYIGANDPDELTGILRHILASFEALRSPANASIPRL